MTVELPDSPADREETYLATIAGETGVELPEEPKSRKEQYLAYIAENGGGGGGGTDLGTNGYNSTNYRLLTNVYDGQSAHDAATKGQLDSAIISGGTTAPTTATVGKVGTLYACVESGTGKLYICTSADDVTPSYV
jgi:hypothetical protein